MADSAEMPRFAAPLPSRRPQTRKPRLPHPHLAPAPKPRDETPARAEAAPRDSAHSDWTPAAVPMARPAGRRRRAPRGTRAERTLRAALRFGFVLNAAALILPRLGSGGIVQWQYDGGDFLLAAAVLASGYALLAIGKVSGPSQP
jgi:hypothetical protein